MLPNHVLGQPSPGHHRPFREYESPSCDFCDSRLQEDRGVRIGRVVDRNIDPQDPGRILAIPCQFGRGSGAWSARTRCP
jgi:hypothetical protein